MDNKPEPTRLAELRETLRVLEESSHLGFNQKGAVKIRRILLQQIEELENQHASEPTPV